MPAPTAPICSQSGALFGLDARLALTIFGVIAVVAGYTAWGRIATAKHAAIIAELDAFENALQHYQTDMGTFYLFTLNKADGDDNSSEDLTALWKKEMVKPGFHQHWNGPYVHRETRVSRNFGTYSMFYAQGNRQNYCTTESDCYVWLSLSNVPAPVWEEVNRYYDEAGGKYREAKGEDIAKGKVQADSATNPRTLIFRTVERPVL